MNASTCGKPGAGRRRGPSPRPGGLQRSSLPCVARVRVELRAVAVLGGVDDEVGAVGRREIFSAQRISLIVQFRWVSLVKKPRILPTSTAFSARAV